MVQDGYDEVLFRTVADSEWTAFKLMAPLDVVDLTRFQGRVITGAPDKTSNPLLSTWVISDLMGGHGVERLKGTDQNRYRFATLQARLPGQMALPKYVLQVTGPNVTRAAPLGDLYESGTYRMYCHYGTSLCLWDEAVLDVGASVHTLGGTPVNKAVEYVGTGTRKLFIPLGSSGYSTWTGAAGANVAAGAGDPAAQAFCVWDDKLVAIDTAGQIWYTTSGNAASWVSYGTTGKLDASYIPRHLTVFYDRSDNPCIHVVTNRGIWAFDPAGPRLYLTEVQFPGHPKHGLGAAVWRGSLYVSNGMGVTQYTGSVNNPGVGLDRDDGLPDQYRSGGYIVDLQNEFNGLYAFAVGEQTGSDCETSIHVWTGFGWHCEFASTAVAPTSKVAWMQVSQAQGVYRLWWGEWGHCWTIVLPIDFANPRTLSLGADGSFDDTSTTRYFESGRFDANMENYQKVANTVEGRVSVEAPETFTLRYRRNGETSYTTIATISDVTLPGAFAVPLGSDLTGGTGTAGVAFNDIEIRLDMRGSANGSSGKSTTSAIVEYLALTYRQLVPGSSSWTAMIDLGGPHQGKSPDTLRTKLDALLSYAGFFEMMYGGTVYRVCFSQLAGRDEGGHDTRATRQVSILEIPQTGIVAGVTVP